VEHACSKFTADEIIARAESRLGEDLYCVFGNNCEHFCNWAIDGEGRSEQVGRATYQAISAALGFVVGGPVGVLTALGTIQLVDKLTNEK
jgi:hypothetical protein